MQFTFKKTIGDTEFVFQEDAKDIKEFFKKVSFISELPSYGPNGETDLILQYRTTKTGDDYYSIVSKKADQELKLGQHKGSETLFVKGWEEIYKGNGEGQAAQNTAQGQNVGLGGNINQNYQAPAAQNQGNAQNSTPSTGLGQTQSTQNGPAQTAAPSSNPAINNPALNNHAEVTPEVLPAQSQVNPTQQQAFDNVLNKYMK